MRIFLPCCRTLCIFFLFLSVFSLFAQESEDTIEGAESLETVRVLKQMYPILMGVGFEILFPFSADSSIQTIEDIETESSINFDSAPNFLENYSFSVNYSFIIGTEFRYVFGLSIPISIDIYSKLGVSYVSAGSKYDDSDDYLGYKSLDFNTDINMRIIFTLHQYSTFGIYVSSGGGIAYPFFRSYGYFKNLLYVPPFSSESDYGNIIDNSDPRLSALQYYVGGSLGIIMNELQHSDLKLILGYTVRFMIADEIDDSRTIIFNKSGEKAMFGFKDYLLQQGVQLELIYIYDMVY